MDQNHRAAKNHQEEWDNYHPHDAQGVPIALYTDEHPATTIKGLGYKNRAMAERTIRLTSQPGVRYKQYWTIRAMRERAHYHAHPTLEMQQAIQVFDKWLKTYQAPTESERQAQQAEWKQFQSLCQTKADQHFCGKITTKAELDRARNDSQAGRKLVMEGLSIALRPSKDPMPRIAFPVTAFTAVFGGPGLHGYGRHEMDSSSSTVTVDGPAALQEVLPNIKTLSIAALLEAFSYRISYDSQQQAASFQVEFDKSRATIDSLWKNRPKSKPAFPHPNLVKAQEPCWTCQICTFEHTGADKELFLACEVCGSPRAQSNTKTQKTLSAAASLVSSLPNPTNTTNKRSLGSPAWGSLRPPSERVISGGRKRQKGLDAPPQLLDYLIVLDYEWTADDTQKMIPIAEITQFPSVAMKVIDYKRKGASASSFPDAPPCQIPLSEDLTMPPTKKTDLDTIAVSAFDTFVRPTFNPRLTPFSISLTAITQEQVDAAPTMDLVIPRYLKWLESLGLVDETGRRIGNWCFVTWGDGDIMSTLLRELKYKSISLPPCFDRWINLKADNMFKKHYGKEPRGGLRHCVEAIAGATWEGRAHNGLVDSINTAKIVRHMAQTGFRFTRSTRGIGRDGVPFGAKNKATGRTKRVRKIA